MSTTDLTARGGHTHPVVKGLAIVLLGATLAAGGWYLWLLSAFGLLGGLAVALGLVGLLTLALLGWRRRDLRGADDRV
ncbi:hypothetical protein [Nocardioides sp.]|uniref:hypothetical protein n=1 Tax=Nocardioides sp. TaxID=35761 RepID=UPI0035697BF5